MSVVATATRAGVGSHPRAMRVSDTRRASATACMGAVFACVFLSCSRSASADLVDGVDLFADDSKEAYVVHLGSDTKAAPLTSEELDVLKDEDKAVLMTAHDGTRYFCELPRVTAERGDEDDVSTSGPRDENAEEDSDAKTALSSEERVAQIERLLDVHQSSCFYRVEGWWTYEFCHKKHVRQYHQESASVPPSEGAANGDGSFSLGVYDEEATEARAAATASPDTSLQALDFSFLEFAHVHAFTGGTECDLNHQERQTEVLFKCAPGNDAKAAIAAIAEPTSCRYSLTFATPALCESDDGASKKQTMQHVRCRRIGVASQERETQTGSSDSRRSEDGLGTDE